MSEERTMVLKMLKDGKITVEEAEALLDALEGSSEEKAENREEGRERKRERARVIVGVGPELEFSEFGEAFDEFGKAFKDKFKFKFKGIKDVFRDMNPGDLFDHVFGRTKAVDIKELAVAGEGVENILLKNTWGDIKVLGADTNEIKIKAKTTAWGFDDETSQEVAMSLRIKTSHAGGEFRIEAEAPGAPEHKRYRIDYDLEVPRRMNLELSSKSGDISVYEIEGNLNLVTLSGDLEADRIKGATQLNTKSGDIRVAHIEGDLDLNSFSGDVRLSDIKGNIKSLTKSGDVKAEDVNGHLTAATLSGDVEAIRVSRGLQAESTSGDVQLKDCQGEIRVKAFSGDVEMKKVLSNRLDASSLSGDVKAEVTLSENGIITMESTSGNVSLKIPESTKAEVIATTVSGDIYCSIPLSSVQKEKKSLRGILNSPGGKIELSSKSGNVSIDALTEVG